MARSCNPDSPDFRFSTCDLAVICESVLSKNMFENNDHIHVFSQGTGAKIPLGANFPIVVVMV